MSTEKNDIKQNKETTKGYPMELILLFVALCLCGIVLLLKVLGVF